MAHSPRSFGLVLRFVALGAATGAAFFLSTAATTSSTDVVPSAPEVRVDGISMERPTTTVTTVAPVAPVAPVESTAVTATTASPAATSTPSTAPSNAAPANAAAIDASAAGNATATPDIGSPGAVRELVLSQISFPWQERLAGWTIEFLPARKGYRGSTFPREQLIQIYLRDELTVSDYVHVVAHEIGHAIDVTYLDDSDHERWNLARGRDGGSQWWVASGADDFASGAGDWAESFAWSQQPSGKFYSRLGGPPTADQLAVMVDIIG